MRRRPRGARVIRLSPAWRVFSPRRARPRILVACSVRPGSVPVPQKGQSVDWFHPSELDRLPICPADRELLPFVFA